MIEANRAGLSEFYRSTSSDREYCVHLVNISPRHGISQLVAMAGVKVFPKGSGKLCNTFRDIEQIRHSAAACGCAIFPRGKEAGQLSFALTDSFWLCDTSLMSPGCACCRLTNQIRTCADSPGKLAWCYPTRRAQAWMCARSRLWVMHSSEP